MIFILFLRLQQNDSKAMVQLFNTAREEFINHMNGLPELRCAKMQEYNQQGLLVFTNQFNKLQCRLVRLQANAQLAINTLHSIMVLVAAICSIKGAQEGRFEAPVAILLVLAVFAFGELLQLLPSQLGVLGKTRYAAERLYPLANPNEEMKDTALSPQNPWNKLDIHLSDYPYIPVSLKQMLTLEFSTEKPYLLVTGRSGSGKSTLAELILGEDHLQSKHLGAIACFKIDGQNVSSEQYSVSLQESSAYLSQRNSILADTLFVNVTLGLSDISEEKVWQVLRLVELDEWAKSLPADLDSWLGDTGQELSGGQARRICLARLLLRTPQLVVLDEPFNGLDESMAERIWRNIEPWLAEKHVMLLVHKVPGFVSLDLLPQQDWQHLQLSSQDE
ncbi:ATP-binding cassette domain-containing protein [Rheinheimera sp. KL1]|uniref:ATP-binding cassette domain-containing protein n=1 Tax=Rheinheimera sp. KL1 TaxID=1635005 RepID=UPI0009E898FA|nr:ATP-binding cassette domain-containing protein [Rheinheimera sp. KL1]